MNYIKMSPLAGMVGYGGGGTGIAIGGSVAAKIHYGDRGIASPGGSATGHTPGDRIHYYAITTTGDASDFGDPTDNKYKVGCCSDGEFGRGLFGGGNKWNNNANITDEIEYITISTTGNATDFGDLDRAVEELSAAGDPGVGKGFFTGGYTTDGNRDGQIDAVTIQTTGNATDWGDQFEASTYHACYSHPGSGRVYQAAGRKNAGDTNVIEVFSTGSAGNATDFGDCAEARQGVCGASNQDRGLFFAGKVDTAGDYMSQKIEYHSLGGSTGSSSHFGNITDRGTRWAGACANETRACMHGGGAHPSNQYGWDDRIEYVTIASTGNATDFGDLTCTVDNIAGCSGD